MDKISSIICSSLIGFLVSAILLTALNSNKPDEFYYLPCEVVAANETSTYFGTVDSDIQQIYAAATGSHRWPDDVPYLLYMDSMGTKEQNDDEILVVWMAD